VISCLETWTRVEGADLLNYHVDSREQMRRQGGLQAQDAEQKSETFFTIGHENFVLNQYLYLTADLQRLHGKFVVCEARRDFFGAV